MITSVSAPSPKGEITLLTITNATGASVTLSSLGAGIVAVNVPDRDGKLADVALGYADPADYIADGPCAGKIPGRVANRIAKGHLEIDGKTYSLPLNCGGGNHLHGGPDGFHNQIWTIEAYDNNSVTFSYLSVDGEMGYPGNLTAKATYTWSDDNVLYLTLEATTDAKTVVNLTNHCYWNLAGHNAGSIFDEYLQIFASKYLLTDPDLVPEGGLEPVAGTPMDFTEPKTIGRDIKKDYPALVNGKGYDSCWALDNYTPGMLTPAVILSDEKTGRVLEVETDQPGVQIYTGNWLAGCPKNKEGRSYDDYDGVAIECQGFPDAHHHPNFPPTYLLPGELYLRHINFKFSVK